MSADERLREAAALFEQRNAVYQSNYRKFGEVMAGMFPQGITLQTAEDHTRFHLLMLQVVKLTRYAGHWDKGHHPDHMKDLAVYAAMLEDYDDEVATR